MNLVVPTRRFLRALSAGTAAIFRACFFKSRHGSRLVITKLLPTLERTFAGSFLRQLALDTPVHGPSPIAISANSKLLRGACALLFVVFVWLTISDMQNATVVYNAESGYVETSIVRQPYLNFSYGLFRLGFVDYRRPLANYTALAQVLNFSLSELRKWNSTTETVLPPIDDHFWLILALVKNIYDTEDDLLAYAKYAANGESVPEELLAVFTAKSLAEMFDIFKSRNVHFSQIYVTAGVLLCRLVSPNIRYDGGVISSSSICRKRNIVVNHGEFELFWYEIPSELLAQIKAPVRRLEISIDGESVADVLRFGLTFNRQSATSIPLNALSGSTLHLRSEKNAWWNCFEARLTQRPPVAYMFERRRGPPCRATSESTSTCEFRCAAAHIARMCGCNLLGYGGKFSLNQRSCVDRNDSRNSSSIFVPFFRACSRSIFRNKHSELSGCIRACKEELCQQEIQRDYERVPAFPCKRRFDNVAPANNRTTIRFDERTFSRLYDYTFTETPTANATTILCLFGGILGNWIGASPLALLHIAIASLIGITRRTVSCIKRRDGVHVSGIDETPEPPSNNLYFHFLTDGLESSGRLKLYVLTTIALCLGMQILDTAIILRVYVGEVTATDITFIDEMTEFLDPTVCFDVLGSPKTPNNQRSDCNVLAPKSSWRDHYACIVALMSMEQNVFFPAAEHDNETFENCAKLLHCANRSVQSILNTASIEICTEAELAAFALQTEATNQPDSSLCRAENVRWTGPYRPFHPNSVVCFAVPENTVRGGGDIIIEAMRRPCIDLDATKCQNVSAVPSWCLDAYFSNEGEAAFLRHPWRDSTAQRNYVRLRTRAAYNIVAEVRTSYVYKNANLTRRPCFEQNTQFECERRCYNEFLFRECAYQSISYGNRRTFEETLPFSDKKFVACLRRLADAVGGTAQRDICLNNCKRESCELSYVFAAPGMGDEVQRGRGFFVQISRLKLLRAVVAEAVVYADLEPIFAALGGSLGLWLGGSMFALCQLALLVLQHCVRRLSDYVERRRTEARTIAPASATVAGSAEDAHGINNARETAERVLHTDARCGDPAETVAVSSSIVQHLHRSAAEVREQSSGNIVIQKHGSCNEATPRPTLSCFPHLWTLRRVCWHMHFAYVARSSRIGKSNVADSSTKPVGIDEQTSVPVRTIGEAFEEPPRRRNNSDLVLEDV